MADVSKINGYNIKDATARAALGDKQDTISDLSTIRSGAALGATALQSVPSTYRTAAEQDIIDDTKSSVSVSVTGTATDVVKYIIIDGVEKKLPSSEISPEVLENFITAEDEDPSSPASKDADTLGGHIPAYYAQKEYVDTQLAQKYVKPSGGIPTADIANASITRAKVSSDILYSPIVYVSSNINLENSHLGKTLIGNYSSSSATRTITITQAISTSLPLGFEVAVCRPFNYSNVKISFSELRLICNNTFMTPAANRTALLPELGTMIALKKIENHSTLGDLWMITGNVEIV